jgi:penicillin-binding protein 2
MAKYYPSYRWPLADTAFLGIGQGILAVTPIQMANLVALVANNGVNYKPHLARSLRNPLNPAKVEKIQPEELHRITGTPEFWTTFKSALVDVIEAGTAGSARIPGIRWGGKTGSAEEKKGNLTHSWFVGFAPYDDPKIAICVFVERGGHGGSVAAPIAKLIVERYLVPPKAAMASSKPRTLPRASVDLSVSPVDR